MDLCGNVCLKNNRAPKYFTFDWLIGNSELNVILTCHNKLISGCCYIYSFCIFKMVFVLNCTTSLYTLMQGLLGTKRILDCIQRAVGSHKRVLAGR